MARLSPSEILPRPRAICVVGPGTRFLSGITYYTYGLTRALSSEFCTSAVLLRQLLPTGLYPGRRRVGAELTRLSVPDGTPVFDGIDWTLIFTFPRAILFLRRERPEVVVFQWWSGTVVHTYLLLSVVARRLGARVVIEFHEVQDPGEQQIRLAARYVRVLAPLLMRRADGFVVHSEYDRELLSSVYRLPAKPTTVIPHAAYDHYSTNSGDIARPANPDVCNILFFGLIRPYKGLPDLIAAFDALDTDEIDDYWLTIVGESWEDSEASHAAIARSRYRSRITFVNRYVNDAEVGGYFSGADVVAVPYHRSSQSGILRIAMHYGLPVVVTDVGGLVEAVDGYAGAVVVPPSDPTRLADGLRQAAAMRGKTFEDGHSWSDTATAYSTFYDAVVTRAPSSKGAGAQR